MNLLTDFIHVKLRDDKTCSDISDQMWEVRRTKLFHVVFIPRKVWTSPACTFLFSWDSSAGSCGLVAWAVLQLLLEPVLLCEQAMQQIKLHNCPNYCDSVHLFGILCIVLVSFHKIYSLKWKVVHVVDATRLLSSRRCPCTKKCYVLNAIYIILPYLKIESRLCEIQMIPKRQLVWQFSSRQTCKTYPYIPSHSMYYLS